MKKKLYFIPGMGESCDLSRYKKLIKAIEDKGYEVKDINPDWYMPISNQIFGTIPKYRGILDTLFLLWNNTSFKHN